MGATPSSEVSVICAACTSATRSPSTWTAVTRPVAGAFAAAAAVSPGSIAETAPLPRSTSTTSFHVTPSLTARSGSSRSRPHPNTAAATTAVMPTVVTSMRRAA